MSLDGTPDGQAPETGGWQAAPVQAAYLGLPREAARLASINFHDRFTYFTDNVNMKVPPASHPRPRFPAFWETKMDYTPDGDHVANSANALQSMLLQSDGGRIYLLPAWPEDWDVSFKLHAPAQTTVECVYRRGKVESLNVTPRSRGKDIINMASAENRVRTLVNVACADRNYLFDIPPMLDGRAAPEDVQRLKTTGPWLAKYGESLYGTRSGPFAPAKWGGSVFKGNAAYLHVLRWPNNGIELPAIGRKLLASAALTGGKPTAAQNERGIIVNLPEGSRDPVDTIIKLEFDGPLEPIALAAPCQGSLTTGRKVTASSAKAGFEPERAVDADAQTAWAAAQSGQSWLEVDLGQPMTFERVEIRLDNPGHFRGQNNGFDIQAKQPDGSWKRCYQGAVYGNICGKRFEPVTAQVIRLNTSAAGVRQFDLFRSNQ